MATTLQDPALEVLRQPRSHRRRHWPVVLVVLALVAAAAFAAWWTLGRDDHPTDARGALVEYCRNRVGVPVYELPSPIPGTRSGLSDALDADFTRPTREAGFPDDPQWVFPDSCDSLQPLARLDGSPPATVDPDSSMLYGWYRVSYAGGEGWIQFYAPVVDEQIRANLSRLEVATFRDGVPGMADLDAGIEASAEVGDPCGDVAITFVSHQPTITNVGTDVGPRAFEVRFVKESEQLDRVVTIELLRGLQPGETLRFGWARDGSIEIDPNHLLSDPPDNNSVGWTSSQLTCQ